MGGDVPGAGRFLGFMGRAIETVHGGPTRGKPSPNRVGIPPKQALATTATRPRSRLREGDGSRRTLRQIRQGSKMAPEDSDQTVVDQEQSGVGWSASRTAEEGSIEAASGTRGF